MERRGEGFGAYDQEEEGVAHEELGRVHNETSHDVQCNQDQWLALVVRILHLMYTRTQLYWLPVKLAMT